MCAMAWRQSAASAAKFPQVPTAKHDLQDLPYQDEGPWHQEGYAYHHVLAGVEAPPSDS
jgi:hypothetical protein